MKNTTNEGAGLPVHDLLSADGDTPETDQLLECDQYKIDEDFVEYSAYRRMAQHAQELERQIKRSRDGVAGCSMLMLEAWGDIFDLVYDGKPVAIEMHPGENGRNHYLFWSPMESPEEIGIWEYIEDSPKPEIRNVWLIGKPAKALRKFIAENANDYQPNQQ